MGNVFTFNEEYINTLVDGVGQSVRTAPSRQVRVAAWLRSSRCSLLRLINGLFQIGIVKPEDFRIAKDEQLIRSGRICFLEDLQLLSDILVDGFGV